MGVKLYVGKLSWRTSSEVLSQAFGEFGQVIDAIVMRDPETGSSRGFGYVTMASPQDADTAIAGLDGQELDGRTIIVRLANKNASLPGGNYVQSSAIKAGHDGRFRVKGLGPYVDEDRLTQVFERFGFVVDATIEKNNTTGRSCGSGIVTMKSAADAAVAVDALDGVALDGERLRISYAGDKPGFGRKALSLLRGFFCLA